MWAHNGDAEVYIQRFLLFRFRRCGEVCIITSLHYVVPDLASDLARRVSVIVVGVDLVRLAIIYVQFSYICAPIVRNMYNL